MFVIHSDLQKADFKEWSSRYFVSVTQNNVRTDSKEFNLKWFPLLHTKQALSHFTWLGVIKRISNSIVQRPKDPRGKKLQMASQYSSSSWHLVKDGFRNTVNFCLSWNSNNQHMQIARIFSLFILHSIFMKKRQIGNMLSSEFWFKNQNQKKKKTKTNKKKEKY